MPNIAEIYSPEIKGQYFGPAVVMDVSETGGLISISLKSQREFNQAYARIAIPLISPLNKGDEILVAGAGIDDLYIIGVLTNIAPHTELPKRHNIGSGAYIMIDDSSQSSTLQVFSKRNELLVEYDPESEKTRINVEKGNLEFTTHNGDIVFDTKQNIRLNGQAIELTSRSTVQLSVADAFGQLVSSLSIRPKHMKISSAEVGITANKSEFHIKETRYLGKIFRGKIEDAQLIAGKLTTIAKSITEKAINVYKTVEQLSQLRAGRMRTLVGSTFHLKAKKTYMKAEEDFKINADKIHLG
jgi:hypothetical protein